MVIKVLSTKVVSLLLSFLLVINIIPTKTLAEGEFIEIDGYKIEILENSSDKISVKLDSNSEEYTMSHEILSNEYSVEKTSIEKNIFKRLFNKNSTTENYEVAVNEFSDEQLVATVTNVEDGEVIKINESSEGIEAQASLVVTGGGIAVAALIKAILLLSATFVIAGVTWYTASKVIAKLKRKQPNTHYYTARLYNGEVLISSAIKSKSAAASRLRANGSVFAISSSHAYSASKSASPIKMVSKSQKHGTGKGHFWHYHPMLKSKVQSSAHCWYP